MAGAHEVTDPVPEHHPVDRLGNEVRRTDLIGPVNGGHVLEAGHHQDGDPVPAGTLADLQAGGKSVHPRHHDVQQDEVRPESLEGGDAVIAVGSLHRGEPGFSEGGRSQQPRTGIVIHHQDQRGGSVPFH